MTSGAVSISNAPRDAEKLQIVGPYMLKRLMKEASDKLGLDFGQERQSAFLRDPIDKRAKDVLELLAQIDKSGGAPAAAPAQEAAPAAEEQKAEAPPKREPVSASKVNGKSTNGASKSDQDGLAILQGVASVIKEVQASLDAMQKAVTATEKSTKRMDVLEGQVTQLAKLQHVTLAVLAQLAETQLGASFADILNDATSSYEANVPAVTKLISGK